MRSCFAVQLVLCLSLGSFQHACSADDNADLPWMRMQLIDCIDLANETIDVSQSYNGNHSESRRYFITLESYMRYMIKPAEDFIRNIQLEENGEWGQAVDSSKSFKSYAWTEVRSIVNQSSEAKYFIYIVHLYALSARAETAISKWEEAKENVASIESKLNDIKNSSYLAVDPVNGAWGQWTYEGYCRGACHQPGHHNRWRRCDNPAPDFGGKDCPGSHREKATCSNTICEDSPINFYAWNTNTLTNISNGDILVFDHIETNDGEAYNNNTGKFITPVSGTYGFSWTIVTEEGRHCGVTLMSNGASSGTARASGSNTAVLKLAEGDVVQVEVTASSDVSYHQISGSGQSTFSGWRISR